MFDGGEGREVARNVATGGVFTGQLLVPKEIVGSVRWAEPPKSFTVAGTLHCSKSH
jgi:hypothetical protein